MSRVNACDNPHVTKRKFDVQIACSIDIGVQLSHTKTPMKCVGFFRPKGKINRSAIMEWTTCQAAWEGKEPSIHLPPSQ